MKLIACGHCDAEVVLICSGVARIGQGGISRCFRCKECERLTWHEFPAVPNYRLPPLGTYDQEIPKLERVPPRNFATET
jgi:hypothetical protein